MGWGRGRIAALIVLGVLLGVAVFVLGYLTAPPSGAPYDGCSDCENWHGRWWEPGFVAFVIVLGNMIWLVGIAVGLGARWVFASVRSGLRSGPA